jgi:CBS domain containing-hemolysin-like protein
MGDVFALLLTVLLIAANAFFVAAEFALISARRDRLEALAEQGKRSAMTVIRAGEDLSVMLAGAQLGITIGSIILGRVGEPAVAHLLEPVFELFGVGDALAHTISFFMAITVVVILHVLLGEMVPKNIALAGPEKAAMLLVPPYLAWVKATRPVIAVYDWCAKTIVRALGVEPKSELENTVSMVELAEMIAESRSQGLLDPEEHMRLSRALHIRNRAVIEVAVPLADIRSVPAAGPGVGPTVTSVENALVRTGYSRFPVEGPVQGEFSGFVHIKDILELIDHPAAVVSAAKVRHLPRIPATTLLPDALSRLRAEKSYLALVTAADGAVCGMVTLENLVGDLVGTVRDGKHR